MALKKHFPKYSLFSEDKSRWKFYHTSSPIINKVKWGFPFLDISFYRETSARIWDDDLSFSRTFRYNRTAIFPLRMRPFEGMMLAAPRNTLAVINKNYNITLCESSHYHHKLEKFTPSNNHRTVLCEAMYEDFPFVFHERLPSGHGMNETLKVGNTVLGWKIIRLHDH